jgi:hypothetical protein
MYSAYDYVINAALGFHVDYDKALGVQFEEHLAKRKITPEKLDSLIEKVEPSISEIHRPIVASKTANQADITAHLASGSSAQVGPLMSRVTFDYLANTVRLDQDTTLEGVISSFNINTYKGRIFSFIDRRPIPFELGDEARDVESLLNVTTSLRANAARRLNPAAAVRLTVTRFESPSGRLKSLRVKKVEAL